MLFHASGLMKMKTANPLSKKKKFNPYLCAIWCKMTPNDYFLPQDYNYIIILIITSEKYIFSQDFKELHTF